MFKLRENIILNMITENTAINIEESNYDEIIKTIQKVIIGQLRDLNDNEELMKEFGPFFDINSLNYTSSKIIGTIIEVNGFDIIPFDFSSFSNRDFRDLLDFIGKEIDIQIERYTINHTAEELLIEVLKFASVLSRLTFLVCAEDSEGIKLNESLENTAFWLRMIDRSNIDDIRGIMGEIKGSLECAVDSILLNKVKFSDEATKKPVDFFKILTLYHAKNILYQIGESIPILRSDRKDFKLDKEKGIMLPEKILEAFSLYSNTTKGEKVRVENDFTKKLFDIFKESLGFQPKDIIKYVTTNEGERAFRILDNYVSIADKELLSIDIMLNQELTSQGVSNLMNVFTLNKEEFYKQNDADKDKKTKHNMGSANSRLFRTPIIRLETKILVPTYTWLESLNYLSLRILNRDIYSDMVTNTWNELIKKSYDEYDLPELELFLHEKNINAQINIDLAQIPELKKDIKSIKKMPHEIDLLYFEKNSLVIMDLKNYGIQHNFMDVRKVVDKINEQKTKMNKLRQFVLDRKNVFEQILESEFNEVNVGILTVNPTVYPYIQKDDSLVKVLSVQSFKEGFE
ncbi:hypothetical protein KHA96_19850 [Bacillus sp. FJAT-49711]|uniref:hypothetical protein n=1 Tax=Bacillus sp. FJAT-49711 TaxID=2833585 RepID=UPI001BCA42FA|nr:hypothetical protein [Bacillus sp. FJAT-49711]MBS4220557.1 hypothetical protein [Bacillus sp. FJAT-49711]